MAGVVVRGDFQKLRKLISGLEALASRGFNERLNNEMGHAALSRVHEGFQRGIDPKGRPWAPLRSRQGQPLRDTGRLMNSITVNANRAGFRLSTSLIYAAVHNFGAIIRAQRAKYLKFRVPHSGNGTWVSVREVKIPRRQFLPDSSGLSADWGEAFAAVAARNRVRVLGR